MKNQTMIKVEKDTVNLLKGLKVIKEEPYNEVVKRLIENFVEDFLNLNDMTKESIKKGLEDMKKGAVFSKEEALDYIRSRH